MTPAEFWGEVRPSGLTAEQELIAFWQRMKDCPCAGHHGPSAGDFVPTRRRARRDRDDDVLLFLLR